MGGLGEDAFSLSSLSSSSPSSSSPLRAVIPYVESSSYSISHRLVLSSDRRRRRHRVPCNSPAPLPSRHSRSQPRSSTPINGNPKSFVIARDLPLFGVGCVSGSDVNVVDVVDEESDDTRGTTPGVPVLVREQKEERREHRSKRRRWRRWWGRTR
ncbi:hypothetical protein ACS0PU_003460 [Formica fusca]